MSWKEHVKNPDQVRALLSNSGKTSTGRSLLFADRPLRSLSLQVPGSDFRALNREAIKGGIFTSAGQVRLFLFVAFVWVAKKERRGLRLR